MHLPRQSLLTSILHTKMDSIVRKKILISLETLKTSGMLSICKKESFHAKRTLNAESVHA